MMEPPVTTWPPNAFTPKRCAFESRPLLELPPPFLCAIALPHHRGRSQRLALSKSKLLSLEALTVHQNLVDLYLNEVLPMPLKLLVLLLAFEVEDQDLVATAFAYDIGQHLRATELLLKLTLFG